jgi:hypothetical protein
MPFIKKAMTLSRKKYFAHVLYEFFLSKAEMTKHRMGLAHLFDRRMRQLPSLPRSLRGARTRGIDGSRHCIERGLGARRVALVLRCTAFAGRRMDAIRPWYKAEWRNERVGTGLRV